MPRNKHKRNWERVAVVKGVFECLSANLALQKFLEQINVCSQSLPRVSFRHVRYSTTKCASTREVNSQLFRCFLLALWQIRRLSYQAPVLREVFSLMRVSRRIYTGSILEELSVYAHTMSRPGSGPDFSQHLKLSSAKPLLCLIFLCRRNSTLWRVSKLVSIILKNRIERAF